MRLSTLALGLAIIVFGQAAQAGPAPDQAAPAQTGEAREPSVADVREAVRDIAFDPSRFFPSPLVKDRSILRITYTGDDYGWPVHAIAVAKGCVDDEKQPKDKCASRLRARMVRAPAPDGMARPRQRGVRLVGQLVERKATTPAQIRAALSQIKPEWVEADLRTCPGAAEVLKRSAEAVWVPEAVADPQPTDELNLVLHADIVKIEIQQYARLTTYRGWLAENSPAVWAQSLAAVLEPCWRAADVPAPWEAPTDR
ncbi:hypothetical protein CFHF_14800 [Caulobacter flavus]|uniref:Uncharacterized protein n=1 Tax=Caulobacter flavus TaxID=1679497 RepID=A0A2N5CRW3_9CAUL|nr:hypothetical protein [Caulobacter flavus]AYV46408.1 hypothetical protein C1707_09115 [Caulobacter flavus]PLR12705.1 hypothetical protein CFHF_14800 [Caulobacter flavus]